MLSRATAIISLLTESEYDTPYELPRHKRPLTPEDMDVGPELHARRDQRDNTLQREKRGKFRDEPLDTSPEDQQTPTTIPRYTYADLPAFYSALPRKLAAYLRKHFAVIEDVIHRSDYHLDRRNVSQQDKEHYVMLGLYSIVKHFKSMGTFESVLNDALRNFTDVEGRIVSPQVLERGLQRYFQSLFLGVSRRELRITLEHFVDDDFIRQDTLEKRRRRSRRPKQ